MDESKIIEGAFRGRMLALARSIVTEEDERPENEDTSSMLERDGVIVEAARELADMVLDEAKARENVGLVLVDAGELEALRAEKARLAAREVELIDRGSGLLDAVRRERAEQQKLTIIADACAKEAARRWFTGWQQDVREFFDAAEQTPDIPDPFRPTEPREESLRAGVRYMAEEFFETLRACFAEDVEEGDTDDDLERSFELDEVEGQVHEFIDTAPMRVSMPAAVDGVVDTIYTALGIVVRLGVDIAPIWAEVHKANMRKQGGPRREDGKKLKPPGWEPADVRRLLIEQGWEPTPVDEAPEPIEIPEGAVIVEAVPTMIIGPHGAFAIAPVEPSDR